MDVQNYMDYFIYQMFIANVDWPGYNIRYWRKQTSEYLPDAPYGHDGRWRWVVHDTDGGIGNATSWTTNMYDIVSDPAGPSWPNPSWSTLKFRKLSENDSFREEFVSRVADFLNSVFHQPYMEAKLDSFVAVYQPELPDHIHRWQRPASIADWNEAIAPMRNFISRRQQVFINHTAAYFGISPEMYTLTVRHPDSWKGEIHVNRLPLRAGYPGIDAPIFPWNGQYFVGQPIQLRADAAEGYRVAGWLTSDGYVDGEVLRISPESAFSAEPVFESVEVRDARYPEAAVLAARDMVFDSWSADEPEGSFPANMVFLQSSMNDPGLNDDVTIPYHIPFNSLADNDYHTNDISSAGLPYVRVRWKYYFTGVRLSAESGTRDMLRIDDISISAAAGVSAEWMAGTLPERVELDQNYPNPFNPVTTFRYRLNERMHVRLEVYSMNGQRVAVLADEFRSAGEYNHLFDASRLASGVYLYRLQTPEAVLLRKMTLIK